MYWSEFDGTTVERTTAGGVVTPNFITGGQSIYGLTTDGTHVYWLNEETGTIGRANLDGSEVDQTLVTGITNVYDDSLAVGAGHIYWTNYEGNSIGRANLEGGEVENEFIAGQVLPYDISVQGEHIYWSDFEGDVARANVDGSEVEEEFLAGVSAYYGLATDSEHIYWTTAGATVARADLDGENVEENFITGQEYTTGLAVDSEHIYWIDSERETIFEANLDGTDPHELVAGIGYAYVLAADLSQPTLSAAASPGATLGGTVTDTATLADATGPNGPSGTLTFKLYGPGDESCAGSPVHTEAVAVHGNGAYTTTPFTPAAAGTYRWTVSYSGDYFPLATDCAATSAAVTVTATPPTLTQVTPVSCGSVVASAGPFVPIKKPGKVVAGVRAKVKVSAPSALTVAPTLIYKGKDGKQHSVPLQTLAFQNPATRNLRMALPAKLRSSLPVGTWVHLSLGIAAVPDASPQCTTPSRTTKKLKAKVVRVLVAGQGGVS